jgi:hypothetical protein
MRDTGLIVNHTDSEFWKGHDSTQVNPSAVPFFEAVDEKIKIIAQCGITADEMRARLGIKPMEESISKGHLNINDLVPNPE